MFYSEWEIDVNNVMKKNFLCLKKLLVKTIIVLTSIYSGSYCKIPSRSNKSILLSFCHKIYLHVKGILNQNKQIQLNEDQVWFNLHAWTQANVYGGDVNICMYPSPLCHFFSLIFGFPFPLSWLRHFWMAPKWCSKKCC